jgi:hypothetical protein
LELLAKLAARGTLRLIAASTHADVIRTMLRHLTRAGAGLPRHRRLDLALTRHHLFPCPLGAGSSRGAPAPHHAGRVW